MKRVLIVFILLGLLLFQTQVSAASGEREILYKALEKCSPKENQLFHYQRKKQSLGHFSEPWQTMSRDYSGAFSLGLGGAELSICDTLDRRGKQYYSQTYYTPGLLYRVYFGRDTYAEIDSEEVKEFLFEAALYSPFFLLKDCNQVLESSEEDVHLIAGAMNTFSYSKEHGTKVELDLDPRNNQLVEARIIYADPLYGDVTKRILYSGYQTMEGSETSYPTRVQEEELDIVKNALSVEWLPAGSSLDWVKMEIPSDYRIGAHVTPKSSIRFEHYDKHVHLLHLPHADEQVLLVEFNDFLLVGEAPFSADNGQMILDEVKKLFPNKPVRYFVFGHHHPHYIGGIRAFVANGAHIISYTEDSTYVQQLVLFLHEIHPDTL
ncbi:MAG: hypothetical protein GC180_08500 [Bacteroidetes bacterium]|nr:hypothetical protein [Bacteroidota bacterium]